MEQEFPDTAGAISPVLHQMAPKAEVTGAESIAPGGGAGTTGRGSPAGLPGRLAGRLGLPGANGCVRHLHEGRRGLILVLKMNRNSESSTVEQDARLEAALWTFRSFLTREGLRFTEQRRKILSRVLEQPAHFDAEDLHRQLVETGERVSLATVYRTLSLLLRAGLVKEVLRCRGRAHYETVYGHPHHDHMVCVECGKVIEFYDGQIEQLQRRVCREHDFQAIEHRMGIRGICAECRARKASRGAEDGD